MKNGEVRFDHAYGTVFRQTSSVPVVRIFVCETGVLDLDFCRTDFTKFCEMWLLRVIDMHLHVQGSV